MALSSKRQNWCIPYVPELHSCVLSLACMLTQTYGHDSFFNMQLRLLMSIDVNLSVIQVYIHISGSRKGWALHNKSLPTLLWSCCVIVLLLLYIYIV